MEGKKPIQKKTTQKIVKPKEVQENIVIKREFELPRKNTIMYYILQILWHLDSRKRKGLSGVLLKSIFKILNLNFCYETLLKLINRCLKNMFSLGMVKKTTPRKFLLTKEYRKYLNSNEFYEESEEMCRKLRYFDLK